jgi:hypothetical protein
MEETQCTLVCSRGILGSCDVYSPHPQSSCAHDKSYLLHMLKSRENHLDGMSIYVCSELLSFFVKDILPNMAKKFVLVTGDSDMCVPREALTNQDFQTLVNHPLLLQWFAQNTKFQSHPKIVQLPIGLDYHTISQDPRHSWKKPEEGSMPRQQEAILMSLRRTMRPFFARELKIYVNFSLSNDRHGQRRDFLRTVPESLCVKESKFIRRTDNWNQILRCAFVASPFGMGMDCHRTWEALCLGAIPIVKAPHFSAMFSGLPVLVVNRWSDVTENLLRQTIHSFRNKPFDGYNKLNLDYWKHTIRKYKN